MVINEVAWMGGVANASAEWLELKNLTNTDIDLTGWTLNAVDGSPKINLNGTIPANGYFLLERTNDESVPGVTADLIYSGVLGNSGEVLELKDGDGNIIDVLDASAGWAGGDNDIKQTMERIATGSWQTSAAVGGTPKLANSAAIEEEAPNDSDSDGQSQGATQGDSQDLSSEAVNNSVPYGAVLINEFVSSPWTGENEWIELYNISGVELALDNWEITDGSGTATPLSGGFEEDNYYFFVVKKPKGALNNSGDEIILYDNWHNIIDKIAYGNYGDQPDNNAPAPSKGESTALKVDGQRKPLDKDSFIVSALPTPGEQNIISAPEDSADVLLETTPEIVPGKIVITEIMPNPVGSDRAGEYLELFNSSDKEVDLAGWRLEIENGRIFEFGKFFNVSRVLKVGEYFTLYRSESNLVLDNNGGEIRLFAPGKSKASQLLQYGPATEGASFCDTENIDLKNVSSSTKSYLQNSLMINRWVWSEILTPGRANQIKIANQPPKISFSAPEKIVTGALVSFDASDSYDENGDELSFAWDFGDGVPIRLETPAHIFYKPGSHKIKLTVSDGQDFSALEKIFKITGVDLSLKESLAINKTPIVLENNLPAGNIDGDQVAEAVSRDSAGANDLADKNVGTKKIASTKNISSPTSKTAVVAAISKPAVFGNSIGNLKLNAAWKISGTVIILPGVFGVQYFYAVPETGAAAVKIYNYYKDFPALAIGDLVQVSGVVGGSEADKYLKTKSQADIKILSQGENIAPEKITAIGLTEENLGKFVQAEGEVESRDASGAVLNDGTGKINLYFKTGAKIDSKRIKAGQKITVTGLLNKVTRGLAILPRGDFDLIVATSSLDEATGFVLGIATGSSGWVLPAREKNFSPLKYGLVIVGGAIFVLAGFLVKKYLFK